MGTQNISCIPYPKPQQLLRFQKLIWSLQHEQAVGAQVFGISAFVVQDPASRPAGSKSSCEIALFCTTSRRIPASASTSQGPEIGDLIPQVFGISAGMVQEEYLKWVFFWSAPALLQGNLAHKKQRPPRTLR